MNAIKRRAGEVKTKIELNGETHHFNAQTISTTLKDDFIVINTYENAFAPFRIYAVELRLKKDTPPGTYELDGNPNNKIKLVYVPPNTNLLNYYVDHSGQFHLTETATLEHVVGSFNCTAISVNSEITAKATLIHGEVSLGQKLRPSSTGTLKGTLQPGKRDFLATDVSMEFVAGAGSNAFLQVIAKIKDTPDRQLHLHIPRDRLGEHTLPITMKEDGTSALATLIYTGVHRATEGVIEYNYNNLKQHFEGKLHFKADEGIAFEDGQFDISGLIPPH